MPEYNLLDQPKKLRRDVSMRLDNKERNRSLALEFGFEYFDGPREQGYGGYRYDGRWVQVAERLKGKYNLVQGSNFLDVGCAKGFLMYDLVNVCPGICIRGIDISSYAKDHAIESIRENIDTGSCLALPYDDNSFDATVAINTIHNLALDECKKAICELIRVTKNKKNIFIQVDAYSNDRELEMFKSWMLTAKTFMKPVEWENTFQEIGYEGDYFWTIIGFEE
jgi:ubiquinone/menaquinone biosynthesis C-methylase UbiE